MRTWACILAAAAVGLAACDEAKPRHPPPEPAPPYADRAPPLGSAERPGLAKWNAQAGVFEMDGQALHTARLWTFDGATDGFTASNAEATIEPSGGLRLVNRGADAILLSPKGLDIPGGRYPLVLVRLTRVKAGGQWAGALFYITAQHQAAEQFRGNAKDMRGPEVGETMTLVYDMRQMPAASDWANSAIDQLRFDSDDAPGGEFVIRQVAVAAAPQPPAPPEGAAAPAPAPAPGA
ncbi:hypothetical protein [Phenylobacterium deserti]|uniref:Lipoprotein n=1 Tax=Phenylobacterium deserti TaxID=1914756 RepID=A0A328ATS8_9CAUL|nr:hypothetical protein [Phenylobacterium deserti]RAK57086.1 hypothetical protein DJ018_03770 [Phenylobacterium deserti]